MTLLRIEPVGDGVTTLTLDRPDKKNALSIALRDEVSDALDELAADDATKAVVITGAGDAFSAGFDLSEFGDTDADHQRRLWASSDRFHRTVLTFPLPLVAAVNGAALAGGFDLAVMCDLRVVGRGARFAHVEHAWTEVVYRPLRELIGGGVARELVLSGRSVDADEALRIGLANRVVDHDRVVAEAVELAATIAEAPAEILRRMKAKLIAAAGIDATVPTVQL